MDVNVGPAPDETQAEIARLIRELGDTSYDVRVSATRRLCMIGGPARDELSRAAAGDDTEVAIRARHVLHTLDRLWFAGCEVVLSASRTRLAWDEAVDLTIEIHNRSAWPAAIPFETEGEKRARLGVDVRQVGDMLDAADMLRVVSAERHEIPLRLDDIAADPAVAHAVESRVDEAPRGIIPPNGSVSIALPAFNRGWARYPLLDAGTYSVQFIYAPEWNDPALSAAQVGRVASNEVSLTVAREAPDTVSRTHATALITLNRQEQWLVAHLTNRTDQAMVVNLNFGGGVPFADGRWVLTDNERLIDIPVPPLQPGASWDAFDEQRLAKVGPGQRIVLAQIEWDQLQRRADESKAAASWQVAFTYSNLCDRAWQRRQGDALLGNEKAPPGLRELLPRRLLTARHHSDRIPLSAIP